MLIDILRFFFGGDFWGYFFIGHEQSSNHSKYLIKGMFEDQSLDKSFVLYANNICLLSVSGTTPDRLTRAGTSGGHGTMGHEVNIRRSSKSTRIRTPNL